MTFRYLIEQGWSLDQIAESVQLGYVEGAGWVDKYGVNLEIAPATDPEDMWEYGGVYPYDNFGTAPIKYLSCSDATDIGRTYNVQGLDVEGNLADCDVTSDGQNNILMSVEFWRVFRVENNSDSGLDTPGIAYVHTDPAPVAGVPAPENVRAIITGTNNQTLMCLYTIPKGYIGLIRRGEVGIELEGNAASLAEYMRVKYSSARVGKLFKTKKSFSLIVGGNNIYQDERAFSDIVPALTDIRIQIDEVSTTMGGWATLDIMLVHQSQVDSAWLQAIGQPT